MKSAQSIWLYSIAAALLTCSTGYALETPIAAGSGSSEFLAVGKPSFLKIVGKGKGPEGTLSVTDGKATGNFTVDLKSLSTDNTMRDKHMKEKYLQTEQYPTAEFHLNSLKTDKPLDKGDVALKDVPFEGTFKLHGVEKPVNGTADVSVEKGTLVGVANFSVKLTDYKIDIPKFAGITVAEDVKVTVHGSGPVSGGK
jgi:polyisoprenoid-binding protein YceI